MNLPSKAILDIAQLATQAINHQVDAIRFMIETDSKIDARLKSGYLVGLANIFASHAAGLAKKTSKSLTFLHKSFRFTKSSLK